MKKQFLSVIFALALVTISLPSCTGNENKVREILEVEGFTDIELTGYAWFCGDKGDTFKCGFRATKNGHKISGCVSSGWLKPYTVRYD